LGNEILVNDADVIIIYFII